MNHHVPKLGLLSSINNSKLNINMPPMRMDELNTENKVGTFSETMLSLARNVNETVNAPDTAMQDMLTGNGADIHDVITAINKAELTVSMATQMTTKVVQAYDRIMNIQV